MKDIDGNRGWCWWVGITIFIFAAGMSFSHFAHAEIPLELEETLPQAVRFWESAKFLPHPLNYVGTSFIGAGDLDEDGLVDLVFGEPVKLHIYWGLGGGKFEKTTVERIDPECSALVDVDGDGKIDLVVSGTYLEGGEWVEGLLILRNNGERTFYRWDLLLTGFSFDLLGKAGSALEHSLLGAVSKWDWGRYLAKAFLVPLGEAQDKAIGQPLLVWEGEGEPFALNDLNGDGLSDLFLMRGKEIVVIIAQSDLPWKEEVVLSWEEPIGDAAVGDFEGDGDLDLFFVASRQAVIALDGGSGEIFQHTLSWEGVEAVAAEFTGDGVLDLLTVDQTGVLQILAGNKNTGFSGVVGEYSLWSGRELYAVEVAGDNRAELIVEDTYYSFLLMSSGVAVGESLFPFTGSFLIGGGDLDGDGAIEVLVQARTGVEVLWNDGEGRLLRWSFVDLAPQYPLAAVTTAESLYILAVDPGPPVGWNLSVRDFQGNEKDSFPLGKEVIPTLAVGDLDGDGEAEVVGVKPGGVWILWPDGELRNYPWPQQLNLVEVGDLDGDGLPEVVITESEGIARVVALKFTNKEHFSTKELFSFQALPIAMAVGDLDGKRGDEVAVVAVTIQGEIKETGYGFQAEVAVETVLLVLVSWDDGKTQQLSWFPERDMPWPMGGLVAGEFTGDGIVDLGLSTAASGEVFLLPGEGGGTFGELVRFFSPVGPLWAGDLDGNGQDELVASSLGAKAAVWILWNGGGR